MQLPCGLAVVEVVGGAVAVVIVVPVVFGACVVPGGAVVMLVVLGAPVVPPPSHGSAVHGPEAVRIGPPDPTALVPVYPLRYPPAPLKTGGQQPQSVPPIQELPVCVQPPTPCQSSEPGSMNCAVFPPAPVPGVLYCHVQFP